MGDLTDNSMDDDEEQGWPPSPSMFKRIGPDDCPMLITGGFDRSDLTGMLYCDEGHLHTPQQLRMADAKNRRFGV